MADGPVYGYPQRPPMPDRFVAGAISTPRNQLPRAVDYEVKQGDTPAMMIDWPSHQGVVVENTTITAPADTSENTLKSTFVWPGTLSQYGGWRLTASGTASGTGGIKTMNVYWGGILIATMSVATAVRAWAIEITAWNQDDTRSQVITVQMSEFPEVGTANVSRIETATVSIENVETA